VKSFLDTSTDKYRKRIVVHKDVAIQLFACGEEIPRYDIIFFVEESKRRRLSEIYVRAYEHHTKDEGKKK
jgi:hypothetical protein